MFHAVKQYARAIGQGAVGLATAGAATLASAQGVDYDVLTDAIDLTGVGTAILTAGGIVIGVMVVYKGYKFVARMLS